MVTFQEWLVEFNNQSSNLYQQLLSKLSSGGSFGWFNPTNGVIHSADLAKFGFDPNQLIQAGVIQPAGEGTFMFNKDLVAVDGRSSPAPPRPPGQSRQLRPGATPPAPPPPPTKRQSRSSIPPPPPQYN